MKSTFMVYGNCQSTAIAAALQRISSFSKHFTFSRIPFCHQITNDQFQQVKSNISGCRLFIFQPIAPTFRGGGFATGDLIDSLPSDTLKVGFPSLQFYGYFPSLVRLNVTSEIRTQAMKIISGYPPLNLENLYEYKDLSAIARSSRITSHILSLFDAGMSSIREEADEVIERSLAILKSREDDDNLVTISRYIRENWRHQHLFYTPRHPSGHVIAEVCRQICSRLELNVLESELESIQRRDSFSYLRLYVPSWIIHEKLDRALSLRMLDDADYFSMSCVDTVSLQLRISGLIAGS